MMSRGLRRAVLLAALICPFFGIPSRSQGPAESGNWAILIAGISGDPELQQGFLTQLKQLRSALESRMGFPASRIFVLADDPAKDTALVQYKSTRENLQKIIQDVARQADNNDTVFVYIIGHGSYEGSNYKLSLVGPDPTGAELAKMIYAIPAGRFAIVNTTTCSGGSIAALSRKGTILLTSTKSGHEKNQTHMSEYFIEGLNGPADVDKNGRVSLLEAFNYAAQKVADYYTRQGNLQTEHAVLDDNGDAQAHDKPSPENGDGLIARTSYLDGGRAVVTAGMTPEQKDLARSVQELERQIEALKYKKAELPPEDYEKRLESLLLKLAQVNAQLRKK